MKPGYWQKGLLAAALALSLGGCTAENTTLKNEEQKSPDDVYKQTITALEIELQQEREAHYITKSELTAEIEALREQLTQLATGGGTNTPDETVELRYRLEGGKAVITGYTGEAAILNIPAELDGYPVSAIGERAFEGAALTAIVVPEGVESVGWFAFYGCERLLSVALPQSVDLIGYAVFDGCPKITVFCPSDSYAQHYAQSYGIAFVNT